VDADEPEAISSAELRMKRDSEREARRARLQDFREVVERAKADMVARGVISPEESKLRNAELGRLILERHEAERAARRERDQQAQ
jgi:hypothetical protein